jgi:hypothetical protein
MRVLPLLLLLAACSHDHSDPAPRAAPPPPAPQPKRTAVGDADLREMISEIAAAKTCTLIRGGFLALADAKNPDAYSGVLWLRDCHTTRDGTHLALTVEGDGWQWADQQTKKAGGTFEVHEYVRFHVKTTLAGSLDVGYAPSTHVVTMWFTPDRAPDVKFEPIGAIPVDEQGAWSNVVGSLSSTFGSSPSEQADGQARDQGTERFQRKLTEGFAATFDLCTGLLRFGLGRPALGAMIPATPGDSPRVPVVLQPGGVMIYGPYPAPHGLTIDTDARTGTFHLAIMCNREAQQVAAAFVAGAPMPAVRTLASRTVAGHARVTAKPASCPMSVVAWSMGPTAPAVVFDWQRPPRQAAAVIGGPVLECSRTTTIEPKPGQ